MGELTPTIFHIVADYARNPLYRSLLKMSEWLTFELVIRSWDEIQLMQFSSTHEANSLIVVDLSIPFVDIKRLFPNRPIFVAADTPQACAAALEAGAEDAVALHGLSEVDTDRVLMARLSIWLERARLKTRLSERESHFRALIHGNGDGILVIDGDGIVRFANPMAGIMFAQPPAQLTGEYFGFPLVVGENTEIDIVTPRGAHRIVELRVVEIEWDESRAHLASLRDITARKMLEAERTEREKLAFALEKEREMRALKERFLTMMSHELRTPLALIRLSHDMLHQYGSRASDEERAQYMENILTQVQHMTEMIGDVMSVSRAESAELEFDPEITDLVGYCDQIVHEFGKSFRGKHRITFNAAFDQIRASVDRRLIRQALISLLSNAAKYSPNGTPIHVRLTADDKNAVLSVSDQGIGVPPDDLARIFEPFHRGSNIETIPGAGLGLAITAGAVKAHRGQVEVETTLGSGSTFTLILPVVISIH